MPSDDTEEFRRPNFEATPTETMGLTALDANTREIILTLLRIEKKVEYGMQTAETALKMARRHEKVLSPVVQLCTWAGGTIATVVGVIEIFKLLTRKQP